MKHTRGTKFRNQNELIVVGALKHILKNTEITEIYLKSQKHQIKLQRRLQSELFCQDSHWLKVVNYLYKKAPSQVYNWILNLPLNCTRISEKVSSRTVLTLRGTDTFSLGQ